MAPPSDAWVYSPRSLAEALDAYARNPGALVIAGGTALFRRVASCRLPSSGPVIPLSGIDELRQVNRTERYLDLGACLSLADLIGLGPRIVPAILLEAAGKVGRAPIRSLATIGGNLCVRERRMDLHPVLSCLDAQAELRCASGSRWVPAARLPLAEADSSAPRAELLVRVRVPLENWNVAFFAKLGGKDAPDVDDFAFVFLAKAARGILSDARVCLSGQSVLRRRDLESGLSGKNLPLARTEVDSALEAYAESARGDVVIPSLRRAQFISLLRGALRSLTG
jgi:CO/xanthine dehydrogenase FAD-binding subunit